MIDCPKLKTKSSKELELYIGKRVKDRRLFLGISQEKLGNYLGVTFQQIQKYEKGVNRISTSTLYHIANILVVDFSYFTEGYKQASSLREENEPIYKPEQTKKKETTELLRSFQKITDITVKKRILDLIKSIASFQK